MIQIVRDCRHRAIEKAVGREIVAIAANRDTMKVLMQQNSNPMSEQDSWDKHDPEGNKPQEGTTTRWSAATASHESPPGQDFDRMAWDSASFISSVVPDLPSAHPSEDEVYSGENPILRGCECPDKESVR